MIIIIILIKKIEKMNHGRDEKLGRAICATPKSES
jgi:hypothetical protein